MRRLNLLVPLAVLIALLVSVDDSAMTDERAVVVDEADISEEEGRLVVIIIDSLRRKTLEADGVMPELLAFAGGDEVRLVDVTTCAANFTYPCLQTMFEGRQSPFVAGLHNFTGRASDGRSVPADLEARGRRLGMISNISMVSLYGQHAEEAVNVEDWPLSHLERDLKSVDVVLEWLDDDELDDLLIHYLGTDKAAHHELPGTEGYEEHFRKVDGRTFEVIDELDLERDHVLITGDHGHDEEGHHTQDSIAIMAGPMWSELFGHLETVEELDQTELTYFMSLASGLELPLHYEGRYFVTEFGIDRQANPLVDAFVQQKHDSLAAAGFEGDDLPTLIDAHRAEAGRQHQRNLVQYLPMLAAFFLWLLVIQGQMSGRAAFRHGWALHLVLAVVCLATWEVVSPSLPLAVALCSAYLAAAILWVQRFGGRRYMLWALALLGATALIGLHVREWADFFHTRGGLVAGQPVFYTMLPLVGLALAWLRFGDLKRAPEGAMAFCLFSLPGGVYYYQFGQNMFWGFLLAAAVVTVAVYATRLRAGVGEFFSELRWTHALPVAVLLGSMVLLLMQESGGWEWDYFPIRWLRDAGVAPTVALYAALIAYLGILLKGWRVRLLMALYMVASLAFAVEIGAMSIFEFVAAHSVVAFIASWLAVSKSPLKLVEPDRSGQRSGLVLFAALLAMAWFIVGGFFIHNIDFHFAFDYFGDLQQDRDIFAGVFAATLVKYGFPLCSLLLIYRLMRGARSFQRAMDWNLFFMAFMMLAIFTQIFFAAVGSTEKLYELAVAQLVFVFILVVTVVVFSILVSVIDRLFWRPERIEG